MPRMTLTTLLAVQTRARNFERVGGEFQMTRHASNDRVEWLAGFDGGEIREGNLRAFGKIVVGDFPTALGLVDDVVEIVLERNASHGL